MVFFGCGDYVDGDLVVPSNGKCFMVVRLDIGHKIKEFSVVNGLVVKFFKLDYMVDVLDFDIVGNLVVYNIFVGNLVS